MERFRYCGALTKVSTEVLTFFVLLYRPLATIKPKTEA